MCLIKTPLIYQTFFNLSILFLKKFKKNIDFLDTTVYNEDTQKGGVKMNVGEKIKNARLARGMTQEELGEILGVQKSAIAKYENGRVVNIKRSTLKKISDALGIPPHELIFENNALSSPSEPQLTEGEKMLLELFRRIPADQQKAFLDMGRIYANSLKKD